VKKQPADAKKAAANDKENGNGKATTKRSKPAEDAKYVLGSVETVRRGFLKLFVEFIQKKGTVSGAVGRRISRPLRGRQKDHG
jgi:hypothetical protein